MNGDGDKIGLVFDAVWPPFDDNVFGDLVPLKDFHHEATMEDDWEKSLAMDLFDFDDWETPFKSIEKIVHDSDEMKLNRIKLTKEKEIDIIKATSLATNAGTSSTSSKGRRTSSSQWKGVTRHKITNKWETHLWDATYERPRAKNAGAKGRLKGRQVYLGGYQTEIAAARVFDLGVLKFFGQSKTKDLNFPISNYEKESALLRIDSPNGSRYAILTICRRVGNINVRPLD